MTLDEIYEKNKTVQGTIFKFKADRLPVAFFCGLFGVQLLAYWHLPHGAAAVAGLILLFPLGSAAIYNHHQQHHNAFNAAVLNRLFELILGMQTMITSYAWVLHHNYGHHPNYMNQPPCTVAEDESRWARRDGSLMGRTEYTINLLFRAPIDSFRVGLKKPRIMLWFILMMVPLLAIHAALAWHDLINYLCIFLVPAFCMLNYVYWLTYEHHSGLYTDDPYGASRNRIGRIYNIRTCNLGYHTAHHLKPFLHWSLLPEYHAIIKDKIPKDCFVECR